MSDPVISLLRDLVSIDSVNPSLVPGAAGEQQIADAIAVTLRGIGMDVQVQDAAPGRPNVVGVLEGTERGRTIMLCGHTDTVGVVGMTAPFDPVIRDGRMYGRGAQDMKGGVAAMIDAARVARERGFRKGRILVAAVADEEYASVGADALVREWKADRAIVTEPTDLKIGIGHKGFAWARVDTNGRAAHGSRPADGRDAIIRMGRVLSRLEQLDRDLQSRRPHPLLGTGSLHASIIEGGRELSSYPDRCRLQLERRTIPGESVETFGREMRAILTALRTDDPELDASVELMFSRPPYEVSPDDDLPRSLSAAAATAGVATSMTGMSFWTDAAILGHAGIPSVLFGPGGAGLHSTEEYVVVADVISCRDTLTEFVLNSLSY
jgi:acetylornithine deacetylase